MPGQDTAAGATRGGPIRPARDLALAAVPRGGRFAAARGVLRQSSRMRDVGSILAGRIALVVDDDRTMQRLLRRTLEHRGFDVRVAGNVYAAVGNVRREPPAVVVLDIHLPGGDGFVVLEWLRSVPALRHVPVVVLSVEDPLRIGPSATAAGATAVLSKSAPLEVIARAIALVASSAPSSPTLH